MGAEAEAVRRIYEDGLLDGDLARLAEAVGPGFEFVNPHDAVEAGTRRGPVEVAAAAEAARASFSASRHELRRLYDGGDRVVAAVTFRARGKGSGVDLEQEEAHTWTFRDGGIVRFEWGRDLGAALAAAGIADGA